MDCTKSLKKTDLCVSNGINLLQIYSHEWNNVAKQDIWKSIINNRLNISNKIYARECVVKIVDNRECKQFLNKNHLQGQDNSKIKLGLYKNGTLVSMMTFSKPRFDKNKEWELVRFCNLLNNTVVGGASKLFKYFITHYNPINIISYADRRYSDGNLYKTLNFSEVSKTPPSYFYIKSGKIISRFMAQKHKLKKILNNYDENKTEVKNMIENKYRRMWDCGNYKFLWNSSK
jgi:hypothetical protein